jgi:hypothetical protein
MIWKKYHRIPKKVIFEYLKIGKAVEYEFNEDDMIAHEKYLHELAREIYAKQLDISKFEIGDIDGMFNGHKKKCLAEKRRRENENTIFGTISKNRLHLVGVPKKLQVAMNRKYSYQVPGYQYTDMFQKRLWDGYKRFVKVHHDIDKISIPYAFINDFKKMLNDFNSHYCSSYRLLIDDEREESIINKTFDTKFATSDIVLRPYQKEAVQAILDKKIGIIAGGCGFGKTLVAAEIIKILSRRTLFLINRVELVTQTAECFSEYLGVEIGTMMEGNIDTNKQITVASIQTLCAILKRKNEDTKQLKLFLHNVTLLIFDECQNCSDGGQYQTIANCLNNAVYVVGLSGSPFRK